MPRPRLEPTTLASLLTISLSFPGCFFAFVSFLDRNNDFRGLSEGRREGRGGTYLGLRSLARSERRFRGSRAGSRYVLSISNRV